MDKVMLLIEIAKGKKTQKELAKIFLTSQQTVSYNLRKLEEEGFIKQQNITEKGKKFLMEVKKEIANIFFKDLLILRGEVFSGVGEGKKYLSMKEYKDKIKGTLGFDPYEGTLNIRLDKTSIANRKKLLEVFDYIEGFEKEGKKYGGFFVAKCSLRGLGCAIILPVKTRYGNEVLEIISPYYLRGKLKLKDGDSVEIVL